MKLIVGLGNPGSEYQLSRHNIGWLILDRLFSDFKFSKKFKALIHIANQDGQKIIYLKPLTMMNESGQSVSRVVDFYKIKLDQLLVIHDDLDLALGKIKLVKSTRAAGHRGVQSIIDYLGSKEFHCLRFGIGRPQRQDPARYVLNKFSKSQLKAIEPSLEQAIELVKEFAK